MVWIWIPNSVIVLAANTCGNGCRLTPKTHFAAAWKIIESAIVIMMTEMIGSPIIGLKTTT